MKLRIKGNSIRLRLTRSEISEIGESGVVADQIDFGAGTTLSYSLRADPTTDTPRTTMDARGIAVFVPAAQIARWVQDETMVSIRADQAIGKQTPLSILVEKDFACLKPREGEDESDMFEHPQPDQAGC